MAPWHSRTMAPGPPPMPLSPRDRHTLAVRAATIGERHAALSAPAVAAAGEAGAALGRWAQMFSPDDTDAFLRRLSWDGLDASSAAQVVLLSDDTDAAVDATWTSWIDRLLAEAPLVQEGVDASTADHPFPEIQALGRAAARRVLQSRLPADVDRLVWPDVLETFEQQLASELGRYADTALFEHFRAFIAAAPSLPGADTAARTHYDAFLSHMLAGGCVAFFLDHAVLARQLAIVLDRWVETTAEFFARLDADRDAIVQAFCVGVDPGRLAFVAPALSDPHHGRRRVVALTFDSGVRIVYKPRSVRIDETFGDLLAWMNQDLDYPLRRLRVLDRETHGWVEFAAHDVFVRHDDVSAYFHRAGALMCLTAVLGARDLHRDNLVATSGGPVIVDLELLLQPDSGQAAAGEHAASSSSRLSCLSTGLLSLVDLTPEGEPHDAGGLRGERSGTLPFAKRVWKQCGSDAVHPDNETTFATPGTHEVRLGDRVQRPGDHAGALVAGFSQAYRTLLTRRGDLLAACSPLMSLAACVVRVLPRPTNQYAMLAHLLATPKYQRNGVAASCAVDVLHRGYARSMTRPPLWAVAVEERRALLALDIPYFSVRADDTAGYAEGRVIADGFFTRSGVDAVVDRLGTLSYIDLAAQVALLRRALSESVESKYEEGGGRRAAGNGRRAAGDAAQATGGGLPATDEGRPETGDRRPAELLDAAEWVARALVARAERVTGGGLVWRYRPPVGGPGWRDHHLYDGGLGPALFFAALARVTGRQEWHDVARDALAPILAHAARHPADVLPVDEPVGGVNGIGSIVYGLTIAASLVDAPECLDVARDLVDAIPSRLAPDGPIDVVDGAAGAALALLALHAATGDQRVLDAAVACGRHLVARSEPDGRGGITWRGADGTCLLGFAHGMAGVASALARLARVTGDDDFVRHARGAYNALRRHRLQGGVSWPIAATADGQAAGGVMNGWCHGAPGVALAALAAVEARPSAPVIRGVERVLHAVAGWQPAQADHVCCGTLGRVDILVTAGQMLKRPEALEAAATMTRRVIERARRRGHFRLSGAGTDYRVFDPGFFQGMSGIGYAILRTMDPGILPSVVAFGAPQATLRYCSSGPETPEHRGRRQSTFQAGAVGTECTS